MSAFRRAGEYVKNAWAKEPALVASFGISILCCIAPLISPWTKYTKMIAEVVPYTYPVPVRDDGNMPDIPAHPCDKEGPSLEWLKTF
ncbi:NADH dehydrogenase [ubiquinone] 1 alpha subcomplex subunit 3 [Pogona vitticeps]|uniref:NADH dehydrogenase [ubiquinone] 1 alpha subcomplex subunit 3 n=1 Tax=Pogona vitticeps TaxID=103695 RepID=A0A6J0U3L8_9SAUR|nr:NADH dehydrogenase [ubiquinone] 1 alpha subcomplex subunit 3 [Pogona vitticeps]